MDDHDPAPAAADAHAFHLERAVGLATANVDAGGGPFGALVVVDGIVVAEGVNQVTATHDPTAHAEVTAIRRACAELGTFALGGAVLYASCEPCPMCLAAAMWARVDAIYYAADRDDAARVGFDDRAFHERFTSPRESWPQPVHAIPLRSRTAPFDAWRAHGSRVEY
ncbi:nucleoside deaminase [Mumia zhuanghuii]|uniref:Nucleoside deaminase n=2 Tax=Mumia TaxID=1546255 RepID=A0ABW1QN79_9ACTN|nr:MULTISPECIES: nucleoside deaminase [Mumia]KAA1422260.1 nucleoside deaminase [Mumia zhuanghuii]